ncbi:putative membrane protein [Fibrobacter succinogenes subsp. succinogenes S85]|uniref:Putative membrane protein n=2 Tax=Fibrobacter succinogenes TaxID=833 RepID=D9S5J9_FIBSS|nr:putative membrane protein [Fibrobacter succinogenes subsp. succinogenes S85]
MPFKRALTYSLVINLFFLALCLLFGDLKFGAIDDYFMAARLTGALGTDYNPHLIFVNAIYGYALLPLYHLFPAIGWYYIGEMFSVFLSFTVIGFILLQRCGEHWGAILAALFTALFASDFYLVVQFTQCASILSAAGMLLFAYGIISQDCHAPNGARNDVWGNIQALAPFILGVALMLWGSVMRWQAFLMGLPFFCLGLLFILRECWSAKWHVIAGLAILFAGAFSMHAFDQKIYQSPAYEAFNKFQSPRVILGDKNNYNKNAVYEDAEELGLSGKDFHLLTEWIFYDTKVLQLIV